MMRAISSPSSSTTGFFTLILAITLSCGFRGRRRSRMGDERAQPRRCACGPPPLMLRAMPALDKHDTPLPTTTVKWRFPAVHPEGRKFVVGAAFVTLLVYFGLSHFLGWL